MQHLWSKGAVVHVHYIILQLQLLKEQRESSLQQCRHQANSQCHVMRLFRKCLNAQNVNHAPNCRRRCHTLFQSRCCYGAIFQMFNSDRLFIFFFFFFFFSRIDSQVKSTLRRRGAGIWGKCWLFSMEASVCCSSPAKPCSMATPSGTAKINSNFELQNAQVKIFWKKKGRPVVSLARRVVQSYIALTWSFWPQVLMSWKRPVIKWVCLVSANPYLNCRRYFNWFI